MSASDTASGTFGDSGGWIRQTVAGLYQLAVDPEAFLDYRDRTSSLLPEMGVLAVAGLVGSVAVALAIEHLKGVYPGATGTDAIAADGNEMALSSSIWREMSGEIMEPLFGIFVAWVLLTVGFYLVTWIYEGRGTVFELSKLTVWGFVPVGIANTIYYGVFAVGMYLSEFTEPTGIGARPENNITWLFNHSRTEPYVLVAAVVGLLLLAWSGYIWMHAVKICRNVTEREAAISVGIPTAIYAGYLLYYGILSWTILAPDEFQPPFDQQAIEAALALL